MYTAQGQLDSRTALKQYSPLVQKLARQMMAKLPASVEIDDLIQVGMLGLNEALSRFDASLGIQFETFATQRVRGAMLDELRSTDRLGRDARQQMRAVEAAVQRLEHRIGRPPKESEIAEEMGLPLGAYQDLLFKLRGAQLVHIEDLSGGEDDEDALDRQLGSSDGAADPLKQLLDSRLRSTLVQAIEALPEREQQVVGMYYEHDMNLKEIGAVLGVTESRVCQIHSQAIARLRVKLRAK